MKKTLWTKNFTIITLGTIISAIGGTAMSFALSFVVFDNSQSTLLTGLFRAVSMLPGMVLPIIASPYVDHFKRKPIIVGLDYLNGMLFLVFGIYLSFSSFNYSVYLIFGFVTSTIGTIYNLAYTSLYPNLIEEGFAQKGYTVSGMIYPTVMVIITPLAGIAYTTFGISFICFFEGVLLILAATVETRIKINETLKREGKFSAKLYWNDLKEGALYFKKEKGLQKIYTYMSISNGAYSGTSGLVMAWFQTTPGLGVAMYSLFTVAEFIGRTIGGLVHYNFEIPNKKRFSFAYFVYQTYSFMDAVLLFLGYPVMLANRCICGFLGINSATMRESSVQNYIPNELRAKMNGLFNVMMSISDIVLCTIIGAMGEILDYRICMIIVSVFVMPVCHFTIFSGREHVKQVYNKKY